MKMLHYGTLAFLFAAFPLSVWLLVAVIKRQIEKGDVDAIGLSYGAAIVAFPLVHVIGYWWSRPFAWLAAMMQLTAGLFLLWTVFRDETVVFSIKGFLLIAWAVFHIMLCVLLLLCRALPQQRKVR